MAAVSENDSSLADKCLAFCQAMNSQGKAFKFSLSIGNTFSFSLDSRGGAEPVPNSGRKRGSPSTLKRNARRRSEFLGKKNATAPVSEENQVDLETSQQALETDTFKCDQCATAFKTRNGLKIHTGKSHKQAPNSPEKLRETSSQSLLAVSPTRENSRTEPCPNCGEDMSPTHLCQDDDLAVEPEVGGEDKQEDIDKGEISATVQTRCAVLVITRKVADVPITIQSGQLGIVLVPTSRQDLVGQDQTWYPHVAA